MSTVFKYIFITIIMKKKEKTGDHTMIQILVITVLCFILGIAVMENMGMRNNVDINK